MNKQFEIFHQSLAWPVRCVPHTTDTCVRCWEWWHQAHVRAARTPVTITWIQWRINWPRLINWEVSADYCGRDVISCGFRLHFTAFNLFLGLREMSHWSQMWDESWAGYCMQPVGGWCQPIGAQYEMAASQSERSAHIVKVWGAGARPKAWSYKATSWSQQSVSLCSELALLESPCLFIVVLLTINQHGKDELNLNSSFTLFKVFLEYLFIYWHFQLSK